ncbi:lipase family protein [soil metagenome]|jgi:pimeloyl-ACP methyl ester carboxylesterase|nr:lipase family protein [Deinococcota bacterium]
MKWQVTGQVKWRMKWRRRALLLLLTLLGLAHAEPGALLSSEFVARYSAAEVGEAVARLYPRGTARGVQYAVDGYYLRYRSRDERGESVEILAQLYLPVLTETASLPIYAVAVGTTGLSDGCAPSLERPGVSNWGDYSAQALAYAGQGYIAVLPDPAGFGDPDRVARYFVAQASAQVLLDAVRAVYGFFEEVGGSELALRPAEAVFLGGYSQGGNSVFAAADMASDYAPELSLSGIIGYGPTTDVAAMLRANPYFAPYLVYAYREVYGEDRVDPGALLEPDVADSLEEDVMNRCVDVIFSFYGSDPAGVFDSGFLEALEADSFGGAYAPFGELLAENSSGLSGSSVPALVFQGTADTIVTPAQQEGFARRACLAGAHITYVSYSNVEHFQTRQFGFRDSLSWMASLIGGDEPRDDCSRFAGD